ncbi:MAG: hypothetical protein CM1200mP10_04310 [Candidatus Neomarinimicrobiota bacterium]|nr:MAG: hypothetical protein CM1200mP10_04310 [Candidatus Neomarinimicrobiota bacterium]
MRGGHSLIPAMKLRLSDPGTLVDISGLDDLKGISRDGDTVRIGALTTHAEVGSLTWSKMAVFRYLKQRYDWRPTGT